MSPNPLSDDPDEIRRSWHVLSDSADAAGSGIFSRDFVWRALNGRIDTEGYRKPGMTAGLIISMVLVGVAILQVCLALALRIPLANWFIGPVVQYFGRNVLGMTLRACYWKARLGRLGQDTLFDQGVDIWNPEQVEIGHHCFIGADVRLSAGSPGRISIGSYTHLGASVFVGGNGTVSVGSNVSIAPFTRLYSATAVAISATHPGRLMSFAHCASQDRRQIKVGHVQVDDYAFIGSHCQLMPGAGLGMGAIVRPYSEVTTVFPAFALVAGPDRARQVGWRRPLRLEPEVVARESK